MEASAPCPGISRVRCVPGLEGHQHPGCCPPALHSFPPDGDTVAGEETSPHTRPARDAKQRVHTDPASACSAAAPGGRHRCDPVSQIKKQQLCPPLASQVTPGSDLNPDPGIGVARCPSGGDRGRQGRWPGRGVRSGRQASVRLRLRGCSEAWRKVPGSSCPGWQALLRLGGGRREMDFLVQ